MVLLLAIMFGWSSKAFNATPPKGEDSQAAAKAPEFEKDVLPIFERNCLRCHDTKTQMGKMDLSSLGSIMAGSDKGIVVVSGKPDESPLYDLVVKGTMPFDHKTQVSPEEMQTIRSWIVSLATNPNAKPIAKLNEFDIIPIMAMHCDTCHGATRKMAGLDLRTRASMLKGGESGPAVVPGDPGKSLVLQKVLSGDMPPMPKVHKGATLPLEEHIPLDEGETAKLRNWIVQGAPEGSVKPDVETTEADPLVTNEDRKFWAFQPPRPVPIPTVAHKERVRNPIDAFILSKLEAKGLTLSPDADRLTLIRRASLDLTGLPPTPEEAQAFLADKDPKAYEKLIDRLLASPHYGERWGRYWLDLAGYADVEEKDVEKRPNAWRYRDYVIRAFNIDKRYDRFLMEQIAGDELVDYQHAPVMTPEIYDDLVATGFMRMSPDTSFQPDEVEADHVHFIEDQMLIFGTTVLALTLQCAECHNHKFDPIPTRDYYRLRAVFRGALDEWDWERPIGVEEEPGLVKMPLRDVPVITPIAAHTTLAVDEENREEKNKELEDQIKVLKADLDAKAKPVKEKLLEKELSALPPEVRDNVSKMLATPPDKRTDDQKSLAQKYEAQLKIDSAKLKKFDADYKQAAEHTEDQILILQSKMIPVPYIQALEDRGEPSPTYIYPRGDYSVFGQIVGPGVPSVLTDGKTPFVVKPPWPGAHKTGRRLALARWLVEPENPLTARVMMNRLWQHHFDKGIVETPDNFGHSGALPTNQELLDWLAIRFQQDGWSIKAMQKLIMTSSTYRQSSELTPLKEKLDLDNILLSRMPLTRMDGETLRDSLLYVSGRLDETPFGPPDLLHLREDGLVTEPDRPEGLRRSIYVEQRRQHVLTVLDLFDYPRMVHNQLSPNCTERPSTMVVPQALFLQNDGLMLKLSNSLADRVKNEVGGDLGKQVDRVFWLVLTRPPTAAERTVVLKTLENATQAGSDGAISAHQALAELCLTLFNSNDFIYVD